MSKRNWHIFLNVFCIRLTSKIKKVILFYISLLVKLLVILTIFNAILTSDAKELGSSFFIILHDVNARSKTWLSHDINTNEGVQPESLTSGYGLCPTRTNLYFTKFILVLI